MTTQKKFILEGSRDIHLTVLWESVRVSDTVLIENYTVTDC